MHLAGSAWRLRLKFLQQCDICLDFRTQHHRGTKIHRYYTDNVPQCFSKSVGYESTSSYNIEGTAEALW